MKKELLLEIGTEEMPANWLSDIATQLKNKIDNLLLAEEITYGESKIFYTPRRIALLIRDVAIKQKDKTIEITGPPKEVALTKDGNWSEAILGFARAHKVSTKELKFKQRGKKEVVYCEKLVKGTSTLNILKSNLPKIIGSLEFPKSMRWEASNFRFGRPIRWIVALFGETVIPFEVAGVKSGRKNWGLRRNPPIIIKEPSSYEKLLEENGIIADPGKRSGFILESIDKIKKEKKLSLDSNYLSEVSNLVECPKAILCKFDEKYLQLPEEVVITAMRAHQRYFELKNSDGVTLSPYFIVIANTREGDIDKIKKGHERVLKARLEDAEFYYKEDMKIPLENRIEELKGITWQEGLGTLYDKTQRLVKLSRYVAEKYIIPQRFSVDLKLLEKSALLCKVDLVTNMIKDGKEFTELAGLYGSILAEKQGVEREVALAMREMNSSTLHLDSPEGAALAIADRIDTIVGAFISGKPPTGSKDPFGIRRAGNELVSWIINSLSTPIHLYIPLKRLISTTCGLYRKNQELKFTVNNIENEIFEFLIQRFRKYLLEDERVRYDIIDAVLEVPNDNLLDLHARVSALNELIHRKNFIPLVRLAKRVRNILNKSQISNLKSQILKELEEKELYEALMSGQGQFENYIKTKDYVSALNWLLNLAPLINNFFDKVLVMAPEPDIRDNRLALLNYLHSFFQKIADFSKIVE